VLIHSILSAARQAWPPFVLVAGLLSIGAVAAEDGLFEAAGARLAATRLSARGLLLALLALVAVVTAVLNLDTSVVFLTPVLVHAARCRRLDERPFIYGSVFMANAASLLLPGSNLTNLLVLRTDPRGGAAFALQMLPVWLTACTITAAFVVVSFPLDGGSRTPVDPPSIRLRVGGAAAIAAALLMITMRDPALPVLAIGIVAAAVRRVRPRFDGRILALLFVLTIALGSLARLWSDPARLLAGRAAWTVAGLGALASVSLNNLPAAVLFSAHQQAHPDALLLGLDLGPNLAVTGSLSAVLWLNAARAVGARASIATYSRFGLALVPLSLAAATAALLVGRL
jgi:arsenical pump membrane protein